MASCISKSPLKTYRPLPTKNISIQKSYFVKPVLIDFYDHIMVTNVSLYTPYVNRLTVEWGRVQHSTFNPTHRDLIGYLWAGLICVNCD